MWGVFWCCGVVLCAVLCVGLWGIKGSCLLCGVSFYKGVICYVSICVVEGFFGGIVSFPVVYWQAVQSCSMFFLRGAPAPC